METCGSRFFSSSSMLALTRMKGVPSCWCPMLSPCTGNAWLIVRARRILCPSPGLPLPGFWLALWGADLADAVRIRLLGQCVAWITLDGFAQVA